MKKRNFITLILGVIVVACGFLYPIVYFAIKHNLKMTYWDAILEIIPCTIFFIGLLIIIFAVLGFIFPRFFEKNCPISTTLTVTATSFCGACVLGCFLNLFTISAFGVKSPVLLPILTAIVPVFFFAGLALAVLYIFFRHKKPSFVGVLIDILIVILTFIPFLFIFAQIQEIATYIFHTFIE